MTNFPSFTAALLALGSTDVERAKALGVSMRSISRYKAGEQLPRLECLMPHPQLLHALATDAEIIATKQEAAPLDQSETA